jgi:hypothetical protein
MKVGYEVTPDGIFRLTVKVDGNTISPAGWRLQRNDPLPIEDFDFFDEDDAKVAVVKLQAYVDTNCVRQIKKKKGRK